MATCCTCGKEYSSKSSLQYYHYNDFPDHTPDSWTECKSCGRFFEDISQHLSLSDCDYIPLNEYQLEVATGFLMGDGSLNYRNKEKPSLQCNMTNKEYLLYLNRVVFENIGLRVYKYLSPKEAAEKDINSGFNKKADEKNYSTVYRFETMAHPSLSHFSDWYSTGKKVWSSDIELTPTVLKHWYVGDGHYDTHGRCDRIEIGISNEMQNKEKVETLFSDVGLEISNWVEYQQNDGHWNVEIAFSNSETDKIFDYMGEPLPGFEYKWPDKYS